ncbi:UNC-like C-terminal-domain-containing protein [Fennellomyces sp. T-0311]|nr:UNC-like C-terminal-domain-containing protein [Fennellomyces sp. T-0311]
MLEMCPAFQQSDLDSFQALFPDVSILSGLGHDADFNLLFPPMFNEEQPQEATEAVTLEPEPRGDTSSTPVIPSSTTRSPTLSATVDHPNNDNNGPLLSFEELRQRVLQKENNVAAGKRRPTGGNIGQMIDSVDGGFADDFGSMFEVGQSPPHANVYDEDEYIEPSRSKPPKEQKLIVEVPIKSLKERFNYASIDCAATVRAANKEAKGAQSILYESKDQYMLNKCSAEKFVVINLCEAVLIDTIVMANFEFFSSTFSEFRVYVADRYPTKDWRLLGQWQARNTRDLQVFKVKNRFGWYENIKIEFLSHYGHEYYCPLSLVRVHGMPMMEYFNLVERRGLFSDGDYQSEDEYLWPSEVRDEIIHPNIETANTSVPTVVDEQDTTNDEEDQQQLSMILPVSDAEDEPLPTVIPDEDKNEATVGIIDEPTPTESIPVISASSNSSDASSSTSTVVPAVVTTESPSILPTETISPEEEPMDTTTVTDPSATHEETKTQTDEAPHNTTVAEESTTQEPEEEPLIKNDGMETTIISSSTTTSSSATHTTTATSHVSSASSTHPINESAAASGRVQKPGSGHKDSYTQESIYKNIMKRLNALELNATLSQRYLDEQNKMLNDVFMNMEKRHQDQIILLLGRLNDTASSRIDNMKRRYEEAYDELQKLSEDNMKEMAAKMALMADQIAFERRVSMAQLVIVIMLFVFVALSRGTLSILSPIMEAQARERKRRESADAQPADPVVPKKPISPPALAVSPESFTTSPERRPRGNSLFRENVPRPKRRWSDDGSSPQDVAFTSELEYEFVRRRKESIDDDAMVPES